MSSPCISNEKGIKHIPTPLSSCQYAYCCIMYMAKKILLMNNEARAAFYLAYVLAGSIICDFYTPPKSYLALKNNLFNIYGIKIGWAWTCILLLPFIFMCTYVCTNKNLSKSFQNCSRMLFSTGIWYVCTSLFMVIEKQFGFCHINDKSNLNYHTCLSKGGTWTGLDMSGHIFLIIYCQLLIGEESRIYAYWEYLRTKANEEKLKSVSDSKGGNLKYNRTNSISPLINRWDAFVRINFILLALLSLVWELLLLGTILYFHTTVQKFSAVVIAIVAWFLTYKMFYLSPSFLSPGLPEVLWQDTGFNCSPTKSSSKKR